MSDSEEHFQEGSYDLLRKNCREAHHNADADDTGAVLGQESWDQDKDSGILCEEKAISHGAQL